MTVPKPAAAADTKDDAKDDVSAPVIVERVPNVNVAPVTPDIDDKDPGINHNVVYG